MEYKKAGDIDYVDLKEVCQTFNQQEHLLGTRINLRKKGFDVLMGAFIKAVLSVPINRWEYIPEDVMVFYKTLPVEYFEAVHVVMSIPENTVACANEGIPTVDAEAGLAPDETAAEDEARVTSLPQSNERTWERFPAKEGKMKVKTTIGLMETIRRLEDLVAALTKGRLFIASGNRMVMLKPGDPVNIKLEASVQKDKKSFQEQIAIALEWIRVDATDGHTIEYSISSKGPENG